MTRDDVHTYGFSELERLRNSVTLDGQLYLVDNIDTAADPYPVDLGLLRCPYPARIMFTVVLFCSRGSIALRVNHADATIGKADVMIIGSGSLVENFRPSADTRIGVMAFSDEAFTLAGSKADAPILKRLLLDRLLVAHLEDDYHAYFEQMYRLLRNLISDQRFENKQQVVGDFFRIMHNLVVHFAPANPSKSHTRSEAIFYDFISEVRRHFRKQRKLKFYADRLCLSPKYLSRVIKEYSGKQPSLWVRDYVILEAKQMLRTGKFSVQQISDELAFQNSSHFAKYFKEAVGCSPMQYQNGRT